jgi:hypothetical protein
MRAGILQLQSNLMLGRFSINGAKEKLRTLSLLLSGNYIPERE